jgi:hypothetical protein
VSQEGVAVHSAPEWVRQGRYDHRKILNRLGVYNDIDKEEAFEVMCELAANPSRKNLIVYEAVRDLVYARGQSEKLPQIGKRPNVDTVMNDLLGMLVRAGFARELDINGKRIISFEAPPSPEESVLETVREQLHREMESLKQDRYLVEGHSLPFPRLESDDLRRTALYSKRNIPDSALRIIDVGDFHMDTIRRFLEEEAGKIVLIRFPAEGIMEETSIIVPVENLSTLYQVAMIKIDAFLGKEDKSVLYKELKGSLKEDPVQFQPGMGIKSTRTLKKIELCKFVIQQVERTASRNEDPVKIMPFLQSCHLALAFLYRQREHEIEEERREEFITTVVASFLEKDQNVLTSPLGPFSRGDLVAAMAQAVLTRKLDLEEFQRQQDVIVEAAMKRMTAVEEGKNLPLLCTLSRIVPGNEPVDYFALRSHIFPYYSARAKSVAEDRTKSLETFLIKRCLELIRENKLPSTAGPKQKEKARELLEGFLRVYLSEYDPDFYLMYLNPRVIHSAIVETARDPEQEILRFFIPNTPVPVPLTEHARIDPDRLFRKARASLPLSEKISLFFRKLFSGLLRSQTASSRKKPFVPQTPDAEEKRRRALREGRMSVHNRHLNRSIPPGLDELYLQKGKEEKERDYRGELDRGTDLMRDLIHKHRKRQG